MTELPWATVTVNGPGWSVVPLKDTTPWDMDGDMDGTYALIPVDSIGERVWLHDEDCPLVRMKRRRLEQLDWPCEQGPCEQGGGWRHLIDGHTTAEAAPKDGPLPT